MSVAVIIVAAGSGSRLGAGLPKALVEVGGGTLLEHSLRTALQVTGLEQVAVVAPASHLETVTELVHGVRAGCVVHVVAGGADRTASVAAGLAALVDGLGDDTTEPRDDSDPSDPSESTDADPQADLVEPQVVLVHDAARCFTPLEVYERVADAVREGWVAVVPGLPVVDTVKVVDERGVVHSTPPRARLRAVQTPQGFVRSELEAAHASGISATDDAALLEQLGHQVLVVEGDPSAFKVTTPADLVRAQRHTVSLSTAPDLDPEAIA